MRCRRPAGESERGAVLVNFAIVFLPILCGFSIAAMVIGRNALDRREVQSAADAMALAAAHSLEQFGLKTDTPNLPNTLRDELAARYLAPKNARLATDPTFQVDFKVERRPRMDEYRAIVHVDVKVTFDSRQNWYGKGLRQRFFPIRVHAYAQVNENEFGDRWPAMVIAIDASQSMGFPILGSSATPAFTVVQQAVLAYAANTLPVRNGVVTFSDGVRRFAPLPQANENNLQKITDALTLTGAPTGLTNARVALEKARSDLENNTQKDDGRNVLFISDGEPTAGPCGPNKDPCHFNEAVQAATLLRDLPDSGVALLTLEIRRSNYWTAVTDFMHQISGGPHTAGNDPTMAFTAQNQIGITNFITGLTRSICAFGPLTPQPLTAGADGPRLRAPIPDPSQDPRRIFVLRREPGGAEHAIEMKPNRDLVPPDEHGFEYMTVGDKSYVILTLASCNWLGNDADNRIVVRWDDPQLVPPP